MSHLLWPHWRRRTPRAAARSRVVAADLGSGGSGALGTLRGHRGRPVRALLLL